MRIVDRGRRGPFVVTFNHRLLIRRGRPRDVAILNHR